MDNNIRNIIFKKHKTLEGFTIVELVIVIAVIAILAAVLIPTFSSMITKSKHSVIKESARNRYIEYFTEYGQGTNFINDVIIKYKEVDCIIFIDGQMVDEVYSLNEAIEEAKIRLNNSELKTYPNDRFKDILIISEQNNNDMDSQEMIGFSPVTSNASLTSGLNILIMYQENMMFPDFTYIGDYDDETKTFKGTKDLYASTLFVIEKYNNDEYWLIKAIIGDENNRIEKYLYMDFSATEAGECRIYLGDYNEGNIDNFLWEINIENGEAIIKTKKIYANSNHYYLSYYPETNQFRCHFGVKYTVKIYVPMFYTIE